MAIGVDQIYLSMTSPETGEYLTGNVYTVDGVYEADGVTLRSLSIGGRRSSVPQKGDSQGPRGRTDNTSIQPSTVRFHHC